MIPGPTACGKSYLAYAFANRACLEGYTCRYYRLPRLWEELKVARANGIDAHGAKVDVLILDDGDLRTPEVERGRDFLEILDDRYQKRSTVVINPLPIAHWQEHLKDTRRYLDRLLPHALKFARDIHSLCVNANGLYKRRRSKR